MKRKFNVTREINRLASLPSEVFEEIMRYVLGVFTKRLQNMAPYRIWEIPVNYTYPN